MTDSNSISHFVLIVDEEIGFLRNLFLQRFDTDKAYANVSFEEFQKALTNEYMYTETELRNIFTKINLDGTGKLSFTEFLAATIEAHGSIEEARIAEAFDRIDDDDSGYITVDNLKDLAGDDEVSPDFLDEIIDEIVTNNVDNADDADWDQSRQISYDDFLGLWDADCDDKLKSSYLDVQRRRRRQRQQQQKPQTQHAVQESSSKTSRQRLPAQSSSISSDDVDNDTISRLDLSSSEGYDADTDDSGKGHFFFEVEKEKSLRGVWIR